MQTTVHKWPKSDATVVNIIESNRIEFDFSVIAQLYFKDSMYCVEYIIRCCCLLCLLSALSCF